jgi:hypothetical protein
MRGLRAEYKVQNAEGEEATALRTVATGDCVHLLALAADIAGESFLHKLRFAAMVIFQLDQ